ncbi:MAG: endonuclease III domain-containing protein [Candidatus Anstonellaceae archaeon]
MKTLFEIYQVLFEKHGPQGWWPLIELKENGGYHPKDYVYPKNKKQIFEISLGAILTQNTSWSNASKALYNLYLKTRLEPKKILSLDKDELSEIIKSAGYYNQKARKILEFSKFFINLKKEPTREELLDVWGIGQETADSILLYAYKKPEFVADKYTFKFFKEMGLFAEKKYDYKKIKEFVQKNLPANFKLYQEFHALIVKEQKQKDKR